MAQWTFDDGGAIARLEQIKQRAASSNMEKLLTPAAMKLRQSIVDEISNKGLVDSGALKNSIQVSFNGIEIQVSTNVVYAAIHEYGGTISAKGGLLKFFIGGRMVQVASVYIPARPYFRPGVEKGKSLVIAAITEAISMIIGG